MTLGVDPRKADQMVRGTVVLPHGLGKSKKVVVICSAEKVQEARDAGADEVGGDDIVARIKEGWVEFVEPPPQPRRLLVGSAVAAVEKGAVAAALLHDIGAHRTQNAKR